MSKDPLDLVGAVLEDTYRVDAFVDEVDLCANYKAYDLAANAPVAVRCLNLPMTLDAELAGPFVDSFRARGRLHCKLAPGNPGFVVTRLAGSTMTRSTGHPIAYEVREWLEGKPLAAHIAARRAEGREAWSLEEVLPFLEPVANALGYLHHQGLVHGEINPNHLFVVESRPKPAVKLLDVGEGRAPGSEPSARPVLRTLLPEYLAPEQADKEAGTVGAWTDVYALAVLLLDLLSGGVAKKGVAAVVLTDPQNRPSPKKLGLTLPRHVEDLLNRALSLDPGKRPPDARAFWDELEVATSPVTERRASTAPVKPTSLRVAGPSRPAPPHPALIPPLVPRDPPPGPDASAAPLLVPLAPPTDRADLPLESDRAPESVKEPAVFMPALGQPTIALRAKVALVRARDWAREQALPWVLARARDPAPRARAAFAAAAFGLISTTTLVIVLGVRSCLHDTTPSMNSPVSLPIPPIAEPSPPAAPAPASTPEPSAGIELPASPPALPVVAFSRTSATSALEEAGKDLAECKRPGGLRGPGTIRAVFEQNGDLARISIGPPYRDTPEGACILYKHAQAHMPPFRGTPMPVNYAFNMP